MNQWILVDSRRPLDVDEDHPKALIQSEEQLRDELNQQVLMTPGVIGLISPDEDFVDVGIGGPFAALGWTPAPSDRRFMGDKVALPDRLWTSKPITFTSEGLPVPIEAQELFPVNEVIEAVVYFYKNHRRPDWITWRQWNPVNDSWETHPANGSPRPVPAQTVAQK